MKYNNYDITLMEYAATGEGLYIDFRINPSKEEIDSEIPNYYHRSIIGCTWEEIYEFLSKKEGDKKIERILIYLKNNHPLEYKLINSGINKMYVKFSKRLNLS